MKSGKVVLGLLAGVAAGAVLGILFAPHKGSKTRKMMLSKGEGYADDVKGKLNGLLDAFKEKYESIKKEAEHLASNGKAKYDAVKNDVKDLTA